MPAAGYHLDLAQRILGDGRDLPFDARKPDSELLLLSGSIAPDMGYFPQGPTAVSDLAHYVSTGDLVRALSRFADDGQTRAWALGWLAGIVSTVMSPIPPADRLREESAAARDRMADDFFRHVSEDLVDVPNINLDTGLPEAGHAPYPPADEVRARVRGPTGQRSGDTEEHA